MTSGNVLRPLPVSLCQDSKVCNKRKPTVQPDKRLSALHFEVKCGFDPECEDVPERCFSGNMHSTHIAAAFSEC
jgi:hypothetical protein